MKKTIIILALLIIVCNAEAQSGSERNRKIQGETSFIFAGASHWTFGGRQSIGYCISPSWFAGIGSGFIANINPDGNNVNLVPVYATGRWYWKDRRWSPFIDMSAGYLFAVSAEAGGGAYIAPMVGLNYHIKGSLSLDLGLGYLYQGCTHNGVPFNQHSPEIRIGLRY